MAYDNFPMDVISLKEKYEALALQENAWLTYYHAPFMFAGKFDSNGRVVKKIAVSATGRSRPKQKKQMHIQNINVQEGHRVAISCPKCAQIRNLSVGKHMGHNHFLTANCPCGAIFGVNLDFRQNYRKDISIGGYYGVETSVIDHDDPDSILTMPVNCRIQNISMGGLGFTALDQIRAQGGDRLMVKFTLDREPPEIVKKEVVVRTILDNYIGCEFIEESGFRDRTLGFYLMK